MIDISVQNIKKAFEEGNDILDGLSFDVNEGERVGLLGKNGAGKTTLLRLITGDLAPDEGAIVLPGFKTVGLISQIPEYPPELTAEGVLRTAFARLRKIGAEMERLEQQMAGDAERAEGSGDRAQETGDAERAEGSGGRAQETGDAGDGVWRGERREERGELGDGGDGSEGSGGRAQETGDAGDGVWRGERREERGELGDGGGGGEGAGAKDKTGKLLREYDALAFEYERSGGYSMDVELNRVANGLRIPHEQRGQPFDSLSGGEKTRINLARLILENTSILLLDEPTNHLDMRAVEWLEEFLLKYKGTALVISHDRYFLDRTINRAIEIDAGKAEFYSGNYSFYVREKQRRYDERLEKYEREQAEARRLSEAAARLHQWGTGNEMLMKKSRSVQKRAERAVRTEKPQKDKTMRAEFGEREFRGDEVLTIRGLLKSYGGRKLFDIPEIEVRGGERIAVIGDNGTGKTTLVRMIVGEEKQDSGTIRLGPSVRTAYLPQIVKFDHPRRTILDTLIYGLDISPQMARNRLGAFMFSGEDVFKQVGDLSGGEKSRLRLCMLMNDDINLLILDEPTNHLDLPSREWIEDAVGKYGETLVFISHDRYFIDRYATRIWEIENGKFADFFGTFAEYRAQKAEAIAAEPAKSAPAPREKSKKKPSERQKAIRQLERDIEKLENELEMINTKKDEFSTDYEKLMELDEREKGVMDMIDNLYKEWEQAAEQPNSEFGIRNSE